MANIVKIEKLRRERGGDDARFLECPHCHSTDFAIVTRFAGQRPFIAGLVCLRCAEEGDRPEIRVKNGFLE